MKDFLKYLKPFEKFTVILIILLYIASMYLVLHGANERDKEYRQLKEMYKEELEK